VGDAFEIRFHEFAGRKYQIDYHRVQKLTDLCVSISRAYGVQVYTSSELELLQYQAANPEGR
jgi:hypothetical protein